MEDVLLLLILQIYLSNDLQTSLKFRISEHFEVNGADNPALGPCPSPFPFPQLKRGSNLQSHPQLSLFAPGTRDVTCPSRAVPGE